MNILRRLPLYRLLVLCGVAVAVGVGATALASALDTGPVPREEPLAHALHTALAGPAPDGVSASIQLTNHLLEGANLASEGAGGGGGGGGLASSPLVNGGSGRLWASGGKFRMELQSERGDTEIVYDGKTLELYDAANNTLYRYTPPAGEGAGSEGAKEGGSHEAPSAAKIEEAIAHLEKHADLSTTPADVAGQPAYTVRLSPKEAGGLFAGVELSFDANNATPLRAAVYSTNSSAPVLELAASEISYGPVESSVFELTPPAGVKVEEIKPGASSSGGAAAPREHARRARSSRHGSAQHPTVTTYGHGPGTIAVVRWKSRGTHGAGEPLQGLPEVKIKGKKASELRTALGTLLSFERRGVHYLLAGSVKPGALEAIASGL